MTTVSAERPEIRRHGSGVEIEPGNLRALRQRRRMTRRQLSDLITALGRVNEHGRPVRMGVDFIGKLESPGSPRKPSEASFDALCTVLMCEPELLVAGAPPVPVPEEAAEREIRFDYNRELREFAKSHGLRYKSPVTGKVDYGVPLREAYIRHRALEQAVVAGRADVPALRASFRQALARVPRARPTPEIPPVAGNRTADGQDGIETLGLSSHARNALAAHGVRTVGQLARFTRRELRQDIRNFGGAAYAETVTALHAAGFALADEADEPAA
jgi:transcriptional regulator with XRE-family HTH domain